MNQQIVTRVHRLDADVNKSARLIEGLAVPYGKPERVSDDGIEWYREEWQRGVFKGSTLPANRGRVWLNLTHDETSPFNRVGKAASLVETDEGLVAVMQVEPGPFGDVALARATDGDMTGLSIAARVRRDRRDGGTVIRTDAVLLHIALVDEPAFQDARVLATRAAREKFPTGRDPREIRARLGLD